jgi:hypothetical protein
MAAFNEGNPLPERATGDYVHTAVKAILAAVPLAGGSAAELFTLIIAPPLEKRRDAWLRDLGDVVKKISERLPALTAEQLSGNEAFISSTLQASQIALRTHQTEKRDYLKNALVHIATEKSADNEEQGFFLTLIDVFTTTHMEILRLFRKRAEFPPDRFRALDANRTLTDSIVLDLNGRGLLNDPRPFAARMREPMHSFVVDPWTLSNLGLRFVAFLSE